LIVFKEKYVHEAFLASVILKGLSAFLELLFGAILLFTREVNEVLSYFVTRELVEDPHDFLATKIMHALPHFTARAQFFAAFYLLSHGVIKAFLFWGLIRKKVWAYPSSMAFLGALIAYQIVKCAISFSWPLALLTAFDALLLLLVWHEYRFLKGEVRADRAGNTRF
jgi:uncharacterized membrane protein